MTAKALAKKEAREQARIERIEARKAERAFNQMCQRYRNAMIELDGKLISAPHMAESSNRVCAFS